MGLKLATATALDMLDTLDLAGRRFVRSRKLFGLCQRQVGGSEGIAARTADGQLVFVAGLYEHAADAAGHVEAEAWFAAGPALRGHLFATIGLLAVALDQAGRIAPGVTVTAHTPAGGVAGPKLARMLGFSCEGEIDCDLGRVSVWRRRL